LQQSLESIAPTDQKEKSARRKKIRSGCAGLICCVAIIVFVIIAVVDKSIPDPNIELPMIKEYGELPLGFT